MATTFSYVGTNLFFPDASQGVSDDANKLCDEIERVWTDFLVPTSNLGWRAAFLELDDICKEASRPNWDGCGGRPVTEEIRRSATVFLRSLPSHIQVPPELAVDPDGEISFEWYRSPIHVFSVSISGQNVLTYAGIFGKNDAHGTEHFAGELPETIQKLLARHFRGSF